MFSTNSVFRRKNNEGQFESEMLTSNGDVAVNIFSDEDDKKVSFLY